MELAKQQAKCRLVCKAWNPIAEEAMFCQNLSEIYDKSFSILYKLLIEKPALAQCIKHMEICITMQTSFSSFNKFFKLVITPNFRVLDGYYVNNMILETLLQVYENSPFKFKNIKQIPTPIRFYETHTKIVDTFKDILQHIDINL